MILKVKRGGSILGPNRKLYTAGMSIPNGLLSTKQVEGHVRSGYLSVLRSRPDEVPVGEIANELTANDKIPGLSEAPGLSTNGTPKVLSRWGVDPDTIRGLDLDQVNVMIFERDPSVDPFEDLAEAVAWISQDYEAPGA